MGDWNEIHQHKTRPYKDEPQRRSCNMRIFILGISLLLIVFAFGLRLILIMSYSSYDQLMRQKDQLLNSPQLSERTMAKLLYAFVDSRIIIGVVGIIGLLISLLVN